MQRAEEHQGGESAPSPGRDHDGAEQTEQRERDEGGIGLVADRAAALLELAAGEARDVRIVDRGEVEHARTRRHVGAARLERDLAEQVAVEATHDGIAVRVTQERARPGPRIGDVDAAAALVAEADRDDLDTGLGGLPCGVEGEGLVILAVGDQDECTLGGPRSAEPRHRAQDRLGETRTAAGDRVRPGAVERETQEALVRRHRREHRRAPREGDQSDLVVAEIGEQIAHLGLRPLEPGGPRIVGQHRARHVEGDHDLRAHAWRGDVAKPPLRLEQSRTHREPRQPDEREPRATPPSRRLYDEPRAERRTDQSIERIVAPTLEPDEADEDEQPDAEHEGPLGMRPMDRPLVHAGSLRSQEACRSAASRSAARAAATKGAKCCSYSR